MPEDTESIASIRLKQYGETAEIPRDCPWIDPPDWWDKGLKAWGELLTEQWEIAKAKPKTARQLRMEEMCRKVGQRTAMDMQELAIKILMGEGE
jgi:hypothetical protein